MWRIWVSRSARQRDSEARRRTVWFASQSSDRSQATGGRQDQRLLTRTVRPGCDAAAPGHTSSGQVFDDIAPGAVVGRPMGDVPEFVGAFASGLADRHGEREVDPAVEG